MAEIKRYLDLVGLGKYDEKIKALIDTKDAAVLKGAKDYADGLADNYDAAGTAQTKVDELANGQVKTNTDNITTLTGKVGNTENLGTTAKDDLVSAINEVRNAVSSGGTAAAISISTETTTTGMAKSYTIKQGDNTVGTIDIPKDMVVSSGVVEVDPADQPAGTYLVLTLANATNDKVYINVGTLVDLYTAKAKATQVQLAIDAATREISATIVAGSITATELAADSVVTAKIADGNVTKAKLSTEVQTSLGKADSAVQAIATGTGNGSIAVDGKDVAVKGLGGAAFVETTAFEAAGTVKALEDGQVTTNKTDIATLKTDVTALKDVTYTAITEEEINGLFA